MDNFAIIALSNIMNIKIKESKQMSDESSLSCPDEGKLSISIKKYLCDADGNNSELEYDKKFSYPSSESLEKNIKTQVLSKI